MRVHLKPGLRRVWRGTGTLQIGLSRRRGTVLTGLTSSDTPLLERLRDGVRPGTTDVGRGAAAVRGRELLRLLDESGVLAGRAAGAPAQARLGPAANRLAPDALVWSLVHPGSGEPWNLLIARAKRSVTIHGGGRLGGVLATTLAAAGVGRVLVEDERRVNAGDLIPGGADPTDLGRPREDAIADAVLRICGGAAGGAGSRPPAPPPVGAGLPESAGQATTDLAGSTGSGSGFADPGDLADLVVLIEHGAADAGRADALVSADVPHLSVVIREDDVVVGPLVRPGDGPCLRCLDLHRSDRDAEWPSVLTQVLNPTPDVPQPEETAISTLAAGLAALQVLAQLDGVSRPAAAGATLEVELPDGLIARRTWPPHPRCGCHWPPRRGSRHPPPNDPGAEDLTGPGADRRESDLPGRFADPAGAAGLPGARGGPRAGRMES